jgi:hypothetical protein
MRNWFVSLAGAVVELDQLLDDGDEVLVLEDAHVLLGVEAQLAVELVAADAAEVEPTRVEEEGLQQAAGVVDGGRISGPDLLVELDQGLVDVG